MPLPVEEGRTHLFCSYCGSQIILTNDNEHIYRHIDETEIKRIESNERLVDKQMGHQAKKTKLLLIIGLVDILVCVILGIVSSALRSDGKIYESRLMIFLIICFIAVPILLTVTVYMLKYSGPSVSKTSGSMLFGLINVETEDRETPGKIVLVLWLIFIMVLFGLYTFWVTGS